MNLGYLQSSSASLNHTLRKGWLMLQGRDETDWNKHWCVLAGLSLCLYKCVFLPLSSCSITRGEEVGGMVHTAHPLKSTTFAVNLGGTPPPPPPNNVFARVLPQNFF